MKSKLWPIIALMMAASLTMGFLFLGCSGSVADGGGASTSETGTVALFLTDGPADDYDTLPISICKVSLIPDEDDDDDSEVVIFEPEECFVRDLLRLRDEEMLLTVNKDVASGRYAKIRLEVEAVWGTGGPCDSFKLPSGKIDLIPRGGIYIEPKKTLAVRLDVDADKSINLHEAGNSGKCIFRPVVFVDIEPIDRPVERCPKIMTGVIARLIKSESSGQTEGFVLDLAGERGFIDVRLSEEPETIIFGEDGNRADASALSVDQHVRVRGKLLPEGDLEASVVVIGDVLNLNGTVVSPVKDAKFPLWLDEGQSFVGDQVDVEISRATLILTGCSEEVSYEAIQRGRRARVIGKYDVDNNVFRAVAVLIEPERIIGDLIAIERPSDGSSDAIAVLTIKDDEAKEHNIFLTEDTPVELQGFGEISLGFLKPLVDNCSETQPKRAIVDLDLEVVDPTAKQVLVQQERISGKVVEIRRDRVLLLDGNRLVRVQEDAKIFLNQKYGDSRVDFDSIVVGDKLTLYGLSDCDVSVDEIEFYAFIVLINESATDCDDDDDDCNGSIPEGCDWTDRLPKLVSDNDVKICLKSGDYYDDLTVNGNNFVLIGEAGYDSGDDDKTIIYGDVTINGNNAIFKNIHFKGKIYKNGNNIIFKNCSFD